MVRPASLAFGLLAKDRSISGLSMDFSGFRFVLTLPAPTFGEGTLVARDDFRPTGIRFESETVDAGAYVFIAWPRSTLKNEREYVVSCRP